MAFRVIGAGLLALAAAATASAATTAVLWWWFWSDVDVEGYLLGGPLVVLVWGQVGGLRATGN